MFVMRMRDYDLVGDLRLFIFDLYWTGLVLPPLSGVSGRTTDHHDDFPRIERANSPTRRNCATMPAKSDDAGCSPERGRKLMNQQPKVIRPSMPAKEISLNLNYFPRISLFHLRCLFHKRPSEAWQLVGVVYRKVSLLIGIFSSAEPHRQSWRPRLRHHGPGRCFTEAGFDETTIVLGWS